MCIIANEGLPSMVALLFCATVIQLNVPKSSGNASSVECRCQGNGITLNVKSITKCE